MAFSLETYALVQTSEVKTHLDISASTYDQVLIDLINAATVWIENYCGGRRFKSTTYTNETYDSNDEPTDEGVQKNLFLKHFPVSAFTTVEYRSGTSTYTAYDSTSYETYTDEGRIYFYGGVPKGKKSIRVTYTAGYTIDWVTQANHTLPHDLTLACKMLVAQEFNRRKSKGIASEGVGSASVSWEQHAKDTGVIDILSKYQRSFV